MDKAVQEKEYFSYLAIQKGIVWWGNETKAGKVRIQRIARLAIQCLGVHQAGSKILEIGCGSGDFTKYFAAETMAQITAVDISPELIKIAKEKLKLSNVVFATADIETLPFEDRSFEAVVGRSILHHLDLARVLPEIKRVLKKDGRIFFSEPNMLNPQVAIQKNIKWIGKLLDDSPDETAFFRWSLASSLVRQGFSNVKVIPIEFLHPLTPPFLIKPISRFSIFLEKIPLIKELSGSLMISAKN